MSSLREGDETTLILRRDAVLALGRAWWAKKAFPRHSLRLRLAPDSLNGPAGRP